jgi:uncharacterized protein YigE (DUF2233 family)
MRYLILTYIILISIGFSSCNAKTVQPGISYQEYRPDDSTLIHVLTIDPRKVKIVAARAQDIGQGIASVEEIAKHFSALAAINGGYFRYNQPNTTIGLPAGILKINNMWHGIAYKARGAIGWDPEKNLVLMDILQTNSRLELNKQLVPIQAMNKISNGNKGALLSDSYIEPIILEQGQTVIFNDSKIQQIFNNGIFNIPQSSYAYNFAGPQLSKIKFKVGDPAHLQIKVLPQISPDKASSWDKLPFIVGGGPLLIHNSKIINDYAREGLKGDFIENTYARTAVGVLANKQIVFVVVEQNSIQEIKGFTIPHLSAYMLSLGCVMAVNLDGGGSSSMYVKDTDAHNIFTPSRQVADVLLVLARG